MPWSLQEVSKLAAKLELKDGMYVNLGIGMPTEVANYTPAGVDVFLQSENGLLGIGPFPEEDKVDPDLIDAGKETVTILPKGCFFNSAESFAMIRGGHIDVTILGALQVSEFGDLANWSIPGKMVKGMGGAMDLVANAKRVVILMSHTAKNGEAKLVKRCTMPRTGKNVVHRVFTELGVFDFISGHLVLSMKPSDISVDEIRSKTEADFLVQLLE